MSRGKYEVISPYQAGGGTIKTATGGRQNEQIYQMLIDAWRKARVEDRVLFMLIINVTRSAQNETRLVLPN